MTQGPKVTLQVVCDGCEHLLQETKTSHPPWYLSECAAPLPELALVRKALMPMTREPHVNVPTPDWCPYRAEAVRAVIG